MVPRHFCLWLESTARAVHNERMNRQMLHLFFCPALMALPSTHTSLQKEETILSLVQKGVVYLKNLDLQKRHLQGPTEVPRKFKHHL